jgi:hypothetical protein
MKGLPPICSALSLRMPFFWQPTLSRAKAPVSYSPAHTLTEQTWQRLVDKKYDDDDDDGNDGHDDDDDADDDDFDCYGEYRGDDDYDDYDDDGYYS